MSDRFVKDPDSVLDYAVDWRDVLEDGESILSYSWTIEDKGNADDLQEHTKGSTLDSGKTLIWLENGVNGERYEVKSRITTSEDRTYDRTFEIRIAEM